VGLEGGNRLRARGRLIADPVSGMVQPTERMRDRDLISEGAATLFSSLPGGRGEVSSRHPQTLILIRSHAIASSKSPATDL
jgi:hypothetical protein